MKVIVTKNLNIRSGTPYITDNNFVGYYKPGDQIEAGRYVVGQSIDNNDKWYKLIDGNYVWHGGTSGIIDTSQPDTSIVSPTFDQIYDLVMQKYCIDKIPGVVGCGKSFQDGYDSIHINLSDQNSQKNILNQYNIYLPNGKMVSISSNIFITGVPKKLSGPPGPGWGLKNVARLDCIGTFGCVVKGNENPGIIYLLSCMHVLNGEKNYENVNLANAKILDADSDNYIADLFKGYRTHEIDAAIAQVKSDNSFDNSFLGCNNQPRDIAQNDCMVTQVYIIGYNLYLDNPAAAKKSGVVCSYNFSTSIEYDESLWQMNNLITLTQPDNTTLTHPGYSGSLVIDQNSQPIGLVVGGDLNFTYAIPINTILNAFNVSIL